MDAVGGALMLGETSDTEKSRVHAWMLAASPTTFGLSVSSALLAVVLGVTALLLRTEVGNAGPGGAAALTAAKLAIGFGVAIMILTVVRALGAATATTVLGTIAATVGFFVVIVLAGTSGSSRDTVRLFDDHGAAIYAFGGAICGVVGMITCVLTPAHRRKRRMVSLVACALPIAIVLPATITMAQGYGNPWQPDVSNASEISPIPTSVGDPAFRIRLYSVDQVAEAGPGFVVLQGRSVTAYAGATGEQRWNFSLGGFTVDSKAEPKVRMRVDAASDQEQVVLTTLTVSVGLSAMTGEILWRQIVERQNPSYEENVEPPALTRDLVAERSNGQLVLTDRRTGRPRQVTPALPPGEVVDVGALTDNRIAITIAPDDADDQTDLVVIDDDGRQVDTTRFSGEVHDITAGPAGSLALTGQDVTDLDLVMRLYEEHRTVTVPLGWHVSSNELASVGSTFVATPLLRRLTLIDPQTARKTTTPEICSDWETSIVDVIPVPGSVVIRCGTDLAEIVGLR